MTEWTKCPEYLNKHLSNYLKLFEQAKKQLELADHMCYVTYPLVNETKFLLSILTHITNSVNLCMQSLLEFERSQKSQNNQNSSEARFARNFIVELNTYKREIEPKYQLDRKYSKLAQKLFELQKANLEANVRFKRGEKYIISLPEFGKIITLDFELVKRYLALAKKFIYEASHIIEKGNERRINI
ncbi:MAG: hypothetical protein ACP5IJ_01690 [Candidatus Nanoarchaeia archaeon]